MLHTGTNTPYRHQPAHGILQAGLALHVVWVDRHQGCRPEVPVGRGACRWLSRSNTPSPNRAVLSIQIAAYLMHTHLCAQFVQQCCIGCRTAIEFALVSSSPATSTWFEPNQQHLVAFTTSLEGLLIIWHIPLHSHTRATSPLMTAHCMHASR